MSRKRIGLIAYVDLDPIPGNFHTEESAHGNVYATLMGRIPGYNPDVDIAPVQYHAFGSGVNRVALVIQVDLDPMPGTFHTKESAHNIVRNILVGVFSHYNPIVSFAPAELQPEYINNEGNVPA